MKKSPIHIIYLICFLILLCSCTISSSGSSIYGFTKRINKLDKSYCLSADGYIIDQESKTFTKYFTINEKNLMQKFTYNQKNEKRRDTKQNAHLRTQNEMRILFFQTSLIENISVKHAKILMA
jgi:hypothetical protein